MKYRYDSRCVEKGDIFLCLPGAEPFCDEAKLRGASSIVYTTRRKMADIAHEFYSYPSKDLVVIGVTGTNGKTSVVHYVTEALRLLGEKPKASGTLFSSLTTPESLDLAEDMASHLKEGGTHFVMEVSSHGIHQDRIRGISFHVKCLTNITQDHVDYHGSFEAYRDTKLRFMADAPHLVFPEDFLTLKLGSLDKDSGFVVQNLLAAKAILMACGYQETDIDSILLTLKPPSGRFEMIESEAPFLVIVDFAHTPDALQTILVEARKQVKLGGKLRVLFGCGGDRDTGKRPMMAHVCETYADDVVVTNDNPRHESESHIFQDILSGFSSGFSGFTVISSRLEAIETILDRSLENDVVVLAGKGHEKVQIIGDSHHAFSDIDCAKTYLDRMYS